ncbi:hypothetical protein [Janibacter sp. GXQ6167]|uniref:hypothetical protein n=1 Tax=Janibacter sp. GXQ6167 TaxID=3240791 RepID=UPI003523D946
MKRPEGKLGVVLALAGLASVIGVAATGATVARAERRRRAYTPDEVRDRLHRRYAEATADEGCEGDPLRTEQS